MEPDQQSDRTFDDKGRIEAELASPETFPTGAEVSTGVPSIAAAIASSETPAQDEPVAMGTPPVIATARRDSSPVGFEVLANAYGDCTWKSLEQTRSYLEKLAAVRSFDKAIELHAEFARQACETFIADSQKIWRLSGELARRIFEPLECLVIAATPR